MKLPLGPADLHVLLALSRGPLHGLGIAEDVARVTGEAVILGPATLYRTLSELTVKGLVEATEAPDPDADARRKYYALTDAGLRQLRSDLEVVRSVAREGTRRLQALAGEPA